MIHSHKTGALYFDQESSGKAGVSNRDKFPEVIHFLEGIIGKKMQSSK